MEIVKVSEERMYQLLPSNVKDSCLSDDAKRVLATLINYFSIVPAARQSKRLTISNSTLRGAVGIGMDVLINAVQELKECGLVERKKGEGRVNGNIPKASEYSINIENLRKPIVKPTTDELLDELFGDNTTDNTNIVSINSKNDDRYAITENELNKMFK